MSEYRTPEEDSIGRTRDPESAPDEGGPPAETGEQPAEMEREGQATEQRDSEERDS